MLTYLRRHSMSLRGHCEVTSGLIQNAHIELKFDMNDPEVNLNMLKWFQISFNVINGSPGYFRFYNTFHLSSEIEILENYYRHKRNEHQMKALYHSGFTTHSDLPPQSKWWSMLNSPVYQCLWSLVFFFFFTSFFFFFYCPCIDVL